MHTRIRVKDFESPNIRALNPPIRKDWRVLFLKKRVIAIQLGSAHNEPGDIGYLYTVKIRFSDDKITKHNLLLSAYSCII